VTVNTFAWWFWCSTDAVLINDVFVLFPGRRHVLRTLQDGRGSIEELVMTDDSRLALYRDEKSEVSMVL